MLKEQENKENSSKLIDAMYNYSRLYIENKQNLNKKIESRTLACLGFAGIELKLIADLFNDLPEHLPKSQKIFFASWQLLAIISTLIGAVKLINSLKISNELIIKTVGIQEITKNQEKFKNREDKFKNSIMLVWEGVNDNLNKLIKVKSEKLNDGIWWLLYGAALYAIGSAIQNYLI